MLRNFLLGLLLACTAPFYAQITSGTIDYTERTEIKLGDWLPADRKKEIEKMFKEGAFDRTGRLTFNSSAFSYTQLPMEKKPQRGRGMWSIRGDDDPEIFYTNVEDSIATDRRKIMTEAFILEEEWKVPQWNIATMKVGMKEIPLPTRLATAVSVEGDTLTAYYTPSIPLSVGPRGYGGLPGAIVYLKVQKEGHSTEYTMKSMSPSGEQLEIEKPSGDKKITREKFEKEQKRVREMQERRRRGWKRNGWGE